MSARHFFRDQTYPTNKACPNRRELDIKGDSARHIQHSSPSRVADLVAAYGDSKFATTLAGAAPNMFTFLRYPGMQPTNNDTERDIRYALAVQRKICRWFVNVRRMHVFSVIQIFNSTCRKLGLAVWRCMEKIVDDQKYDILEAGDDVRRVATPWSEAKPVAYRLCVDGNMVETNGAERSRTGRGHRRGAGRGGGERET